jgi:glycosyltransferase involved in cell wall biosynthesis
VGKSLSKTTPSIAVVIPTRNRENLLVQVLDDLAQQILIPRIVVIVDSSDKTSIIQRSDLKVVVIHSVVRSAAIQRNLGIEFLNESGHDFEYCAFLDDDIRIDRNYLNDLVETLSRTQGAIGVSGLAIGDKETKYRRNRLLDILGFSGPEGTLTKGAINVPVRKAKNTVRVEWLIGCSAWKFQCLASLRFQEDFLGQSIFEDVIFSVQAMKFGDLFVNPRIRFRHLLSEENRPNSFNHYNAWVRNRFRLKRIAPSKVNMIQFSIVNLLIAAKLMIQGKFTGVLGIVVAMLRNGLK